MANAHTEEFLHTSNYELQRINYGITMWLHVAWLRITNYNAQATGLQCGFMWPGYELQITYYGAWES